MTAERQHAASFGKLFSLFCCLSLACLLILLLLLMSGSVHPNPVPVFPCSVCTGNVTWRNRLVQYFTYFKWFQLRCSLLSFSRVKTLGGSQFWSCPPCCDFGFSSDPTPSNTLSSSLDSSSLYTFTVLRSLSVAPLLMQRSRSTLVFKAFIILLPTSYLLFLHPSHPLMFLAVFQYLLLPLPP